MSSTRTSGSCRIDTQAKSFLEWGFAALSLVIWWYVAPALTRANALIDRSLLAPNRTEQLTQRVQDLADSRAQSVDSSAAELRRVERDLHDGAQARLVALGMNLGMADDLMDKDPDTARQLLTEARIDESGRAG